MVRMDGVAGGNMLSDEYVLLRRAALMVCRVRCNADAASDDDSPCVIEGINCRLNGDCGGNDEIMLMVFCAMVVSVLVVESCCCMFSETSGMFS